MKKTLTVLIVLGTLAAAATLSPDAAAAACHWVWTPWGGWMCA